MKKRQTSSFSFFPPLFLPLSPRRQSPGSRPRPPRRTQQRSRRKGRGRKDREGPSKALLLLPWSRGRSLRRRRPRPARCGPLGRSPRQEKGRARRQERRGEPFCFFFGGGVVGVVDRVEREKVREKAKMTRRQFFFHFSLLRSSERASERVEKRSSFLSFSCAPFPAPATMLSARSRLSLLVRGTRSSSSIDEALRGVGSWATVCADGMGARDGPAKAYNLGEGIEIGLMASFSLPLFFARLRCIRNMLSNSHSQITLLIRRVLSATRRACRRNREVSGGGISALHFDDLGRPFFRSPRPSLSLSVKKKKKRSRQSAAAGPAPRRTSKSQTP